MSKMYVTKEQLTNLFTDKREKFMGPFTWFYAFLVLLIMFFPFIATIIQFMLLLICYIPFYILDEFIIRRLLHAKTE